MCRAEGLREIVGHAGREARRRVFRPRLRRDEDHGHVPQGGILVVAERASDLDPVRAGKDRLPAVKESGKVVNDRTTNWSIIPCPTPAWAKLVFPDDPAVGQVYLSVYLPEEQALLGTSGPWNQEQFNPWRVKFSEVVSLIAHDSKWEAKSDRDIYNQVQRFTLDDVTKFQQQYIKGRPANVVVIGDRDKIDFKALKQYGEVRELSLDEIFGYEKVEKVNLERPLP